MMAKPMKTLELHYPIIQSLVILNTIDILFSICCEQVLMFCGTSESEGARDETVSEER